MTLLIKQYDLKLTFSEIAFVFTLCRQSGPHSISILNERQPYTIKTPKMDVRAIIWNDE